jgi:hypothetical protein
MIKLYRGNNFDNNTLVGSIEGTTVYRENPVDTERVTTQPGLPPATIPFTARPHWPIEQPQYQPVPLRNDFLHQTGVPKAPVGYIEGNNICHQGKALAGYINGSTVYNAQRQVVGFIEGNTVYRGGDRRYKLPIGHVDTTSISPFSPQVTKELAGAVLLLLL